MKVYEVTAVLDGTRVVIEVEAFTPEEARQSVLQAYPKIGIVEVRWTLFQR